MLYMTIIYIQSILYISSNLYIIMRYPLSKNKNITN